MSDLTNKVNAWHEEAMDLAEMAFFAKRGGELYNYWKYIQRALNYEKAACKLLISSTSIEPSRSILYYGAIHLAINLEYFDEAKQLVREVLEGDTSINIRSEFENLNSQIAEREKLRSRTVVLAQSFLDSEEISALDVTRAIDAAIAAVESFYRKENISELIDKTSLRVTLESKNLVSNSKYQIFEENITNQIWYKERKSQLNWNFWKAYKTFLDKKNFAASTVKHLDILTDDILGRIGDPLRPGIWDKRGMIVGDVQSGKTSNYIGLINKAADLGFRIVIVLTGLYENLRQQTQIRIDEGFVGFLSDLNNPNSGSPIGVELYRSPRNLPVHPITRAGESGDLSKSNLPNLPIETNDYYAIVIKKNPDVLNALLNWLYVRGENDGDYRIIRNRPLLVIDDEADYASINVDKEFVSKINGCIRATLALFEKSAFIGYTATPFANVFISDFNETEGKSINIGRKQFRLGEDLFPRDFIINLPPPSNYIGYSKVFETKLDSEKGYFEGDLPMVNIITDFETDLPKRHKKNDELPSRIPQSLVYAVKCFFIVCATRIARGQQKEHNSMLVHVSWYVRWIDHIALLIHNFSEELKKEIRSENLKLLIEFKIIWEREFKIRTPKIISQLEYDDPHLVEHEWEEIQPFLLRAIEKIEVRAVHGSKKDLKFQNSSALNYNDYRNGISIIAVGGNKLSRGLTLEGLSISYFLRATRFYDTLLQMGRWFGYRAGYVDLCRLFTTEELIIWYQYIASATEELKEQFDIMDLAERTPKNFGIKVRSAPGMLMISSAAKIKGATDLSLSFSGDLQETYILSKTDSIIENNIKALNLLIEKIGTPTGIVRQGQPYIWQEIRYSQIDDFIADFKTQQRNIHPDFIRAYIGQQLKNGNLNNWTIVLISSSNAKEFYSFVTSNYSFNVGYTFRKEVEEINAAGELIINQQQYLIRKSHIISPPHEYLDMETNDERYLQARIDTLENTKSAIVPISPAGKFIRKYRGAKNALLLIYILDPLGFRGKPGMPAVGYAISFPEIKNDEKIPYKVNRQFLENIFDIPPEAEENPEEEDG